MFQCAENTDRSLPYSKAARRANRSRSGRTGTLGLPPGAARSRAPVAVCVLFAALLPGCTLCQNIKRSVITEPTRYCAAADRWRSVRTYRRWADDVYSRMYGCGGGVHYSDAFEAGFKDGFVDYVYGGGSGEPPPVAPREFWDVRHRNPEGNAHAADWFDGYRTGAQVARDEGFRERALAPTSKLLVEPIEDYHQFSHEGEMRIPTTMPDLPKAEPLPLGPLEPDAQTPNIPSEEPETQFPSPTDEPPVLQAPEIESVPMPTPEQDLEQADPLPSAPIPEDINPEETNPAEEIDQIFGPPIDLRSTEVSPTSERTSRTRTALTLDQEQARAAFASAIQSNRAAKQTFNKSPMRDAAKDAKRRYVAKQNQRPPKRTPSTFSPSQTIIQQTSVSLISRPPSIPRSDDRSAEMFRRLSDSE